MGGQLTSNAANKASYTSAASTLPRRLRGLGTRCHCVSSSDIAAPAGQCAPSVAYRPGSKSLGNRDTVQVSYKYQLDVSTNKTVWMMLDIQHPGTTRYFMKLNVWL